MYLYSKEGRRYRCDLAIGDFEVLVRLAENPHPPLSFSFHVEPEGEPHRSLALFFREVNVALTLDRHAHEFVEDSLFPPGRRLR